MTAFPGNDTTICKGVSVGIGADPIASGGTPAYTFSWSPALGLDNTALQQPNII